MSELASESLMQTVPLDTEIELPTAADTEALGERLADGLSAGDLVVLTGPLGAGKTVLVRGLARGLGVTGAVTSPTFVIARIILRAVLSASSSASPTIPIARVLSPNPSSVVKSSSHRSSPPASAA